MLKTAVSVEADLASRIAIRYACQLGRSIDMTISTIHALEPGEEGQAIATGWVRQTWENAVSQETASRVSRLVKSEQAGCRLLENPVFLPPVHSRDERITDFIRSNECGLLVEGILHRFEPDQFLAKFGSKLYRALPCPILLVKNLTPLSKGVLWVTEGKIPERMVETFLRIFPIQSIDLEFLICGFDQSPPAAAVDKAASLLESAGGTIKKVSNVEGPPSSMATLVRDHFLIVSAMPSEKGPMAKLLSKSPCSLLFLS
jgi:nucleotide-binding universal stress UspA family protein